MGAPRGYAGHTGWRLDAWLTALLSLGILVAANRLARETLDLRVDLSQDQLYAPSPVGRRMMGELEDLLQVKAFFTGEMRLGPVQIAKRRLIDQLEELADVAGGRVELSFVDPNASSEARAEAQALGIRPVPMRSVQGTAAVTQDVYLGLLLRYGGREAALPFVLPQTFEYGFLGSLRKLLRPEEVDVGFLTHRGDGGEDEFGAIRALLAGQYRLREVLDLDVGEPVPDSVAVLVVARPLELHPRTVFAIDQFLQRGGRALVLVDHASVDLVAGELTPVSSGLERALALWGAPVGEGFVWDQEHANRIVTRPGSEAGDEPASSVRIPFPFWPYVSVEGLDRETPVTARIQGADFFWVHPIHAADALDPGVNRRELLRSSPTSFEVGIEEGLTIDPAALARRAVELSASGDPRPRSLAVALSGRFPSPFVDGAPAPRDPLEEALRAERLRRDPRGDGAPAPRDPLEEALRAERLRRDPRGGGEPPTADEPATTAEPVASAAAETQLVVVGDADWVSDGKFLTDRNKILFVNLIDWLALEDDLIALRSRFPTERKIDDFVEEERRALGLVGPPADLGDLASPTVARLESQAERLAARRRWWTMGRATGGSLLAAALLGLLWKLVWGRAPRVAVEEGR